MTCHVSCDWLELFCSAAESCPLFIPFSTEHIEVDAPSITFRGIEFHGQLRPYGTRVYKYVWEYVDKNGLVFLTICLDPLSKRSEGGLMYDDMCHVKLGNYWLYTDLWFDALNHALRVLRIKPLRASRVDICCDVQYFACGISAGALMAGLVQDKYCKVHQPKWTLHAIDSQKGRYYNTLCFGSKQSAVYTRMYNKTLELQTSGKMYIVDSWEKNCAFDLTKPVYRVEFEIHDVKSVDKETGCVMEIDWEQLRHREYIEQQFLYYAGYFFDIRKRDNPRKDRCTPLLLFNASECQYKAWQNPRAEVSSRTARVVEHWLRDNATSLAVTADDVNALLKCLYSVILKNKSYGKLRNATDD